MNYENYSQQTNWPEMCIRDSIEAGDERRARAKFHWQFLEHYPAAQDCAYKFIVCEDKPGIPRPALDSWDAEYMQENRWDEESDVYKRQSTLCHEK